MEAIREKVADEEDDVHEFSFSISVNPPESCPSAAAVDLSPADEIFYHGHLLPLHLLSVSPRSSVESFTLPINELNGDECRMAYTGIKIEDTHSEEKENFGLFSMPRCESKKKKGKKNKKKKFDVHKWYEKLVQPILGSLRNRGEKQGKKDSLANRLPLSNELWMKRNKEVIRRSAPVTMRSSPENSGLLAGSGNSIPTPQNDSTMEELQVAIEAAIAHCKNSIVAPDKLNQQP